MDRRATFPPYSLLESLNSPVGSRRRAPKRSMENFDFSIFLKNDFIGPNGNNPLPMLPEKVRRDRFMQHTYQSGSADYQDISGCLSPPSGPPGPKTRGGTDNIPDPDLRILVRF